MIDNMHTFDRLNDKEKIEELVIASKQNDKYAFVQLCDIFSFLISSIAKSYVISCNDFDDLLQVGRIALYRAVCRYDDTKKASFSTFASVCIRNALTSFMRSYQSKNKLPAELISLDDDTSAEVLAFDDVTPENVLIETEFFQNLENIIDTRLSKYEKIVLRYKLSGMSTSEISEKMGKEKKLVENSLFRARRKLKIFLSEN